MKRIAIVLALVVGAIALADRTDIWNAATVNVTVVDLVARLDGGCAVSARATYSKQDGGTAIEDSAVVDVAGANRTACLDILTKAAVLFKNDKGL